MTEESPKDLYTKKLINWLTEGNRYLLSFPDEVSLTRKKILRNDLPSPSTDPIGAYKELTERLRNPTPENVSLEAIMGTIDLSLLDPALTDKQIDGGLETAKKYRVASVCINEDNLEKALGVPEGTGVAVGVVVNFPNGRASTKTKVKLAIDALKRGATEIDMPINVGKLKSGEYRYVYNELRAVWKVVREKGAIFKPIARVDDLQTAWRESDKYVGCADNPLIVRYCQMVNQLQNELPGGYHQLMAKTSTGFDYQTIEGQSGKDYEGATDKVLKIFSDVCPYGKPVGIKAAGKIRTPDDFLRVMKNFAVVRIGCTKTEKVANGLLKMGYKSHLNPSRG